jgi:hypothetical protein
MCRRPQERQAAWTVKRRYDLIIIQGVTRLCNKTDLEGLPQEKVRLASHAGVVFDHIRAAHLEGGHCKVTTTARTVSLLLLAICRRHFFPP